MEISTANIVFENNTIDTRKSEKTSKMSKQFLDILNENKFQSASDENADLFGRDGLEQEQSLSITESSARAIKASNFSEANLVDEQDIDLGKEFMLDNFAGLASDGQIEKYIEAEVYGFSAFAINKLSYRSLVRFIDFAISSEYAKGQKFSHNEVHGLSAHIGVDTEKTSHSVTEKPVAQPAQFAKNEVENNLARASGKKHTPHFDKSSEWLDRHVLISVSDSEIKIVLRDYRLDTRQKEALVDFLARKYSSSDNRHFSSITINGENFLIKRSC